MIAHLLIDGSWRMAGDAATLDVLDPATDAVIGQVARATLADLEEAADAAARGFAAWSRRSAYDRSAILRRAAALVRDDLDTLAATLTREQGKPLAEARLEILGACDMIEWLAEEGRRAYGRIVPGRAIEICQQVIREPVGPVVAFAPWNFPVAQIARKLGAALAAGCSIIVKAPEETPFAAAAFIDAFVRAGVPAGVVGLVYGVPAQISEFLIAHPAIRKISFTGSTPVGKSLAALAGTHMKRATMELGGHGPVIICADADLDNAVEVLVAAKFRNAGQVCTAPTRFLVQDAVHERFLERFIAKVDTITVGAGADPSTKMGPLAHPRRLAAMERLVQDGVAAGAKLATGGRRIGNAGCFFAPTVLSHVPVSAAAMNEEPFGPLALVNPFGDLDEAIAEANRLPYGLAAYAFTRSATVTSTLARRLASGNVAVNHTAIALAEIPFGGVKDSGYGLEGGSEGLDAYLATKLVTTLHR